MSLQGTIETFAIADVLRLLAATNKSGRLQVQGPSRSGTVWVDEAKVLSAEAPAVPYADHPAEVLFQLLRFDRGSFRFDLDKYPPAPAEPIEIEFALGEAESMLAEWRELEKKIPSTEGWVSLTRELRDSSVTVSAEQWRTVGAIGSGCVISALGEALSLGELDTYRAIDQLLDLGLAEVGHRPASAPSLEAPVATAPARAVPPAPAAEAFPPDGGAPPTVAATPSEAAAPDADSTSSVGANMPGSGSNGLAPDTAIANATSVAAEAQAPPSSWPLAAAPPVAAEAPPSTSFSPPPAAPAPPPDTVAPRAEVGLSQPGAASSEAAPGFAQGYDAPPTSSSAPDTPSTPGAVPGAPAPPYGEYPYGASGYGVSDYRPASGFEFTAGAASSTFAFEAPAVAELDDRGASPGSEGDNGTARPAPSAPVGPTSAEKGAAPAVAGDATQPSALFEVGAPPPPPPAPPLPGRDASPPAPGGWSPASWFEGSMPERIAPPPPPPPPPGGPGGWGEQARTASGADTVAATGAPAEATSDVRTDQGEDAANIERQLFNLSERARDAVKRSSGLFDGRSRR